MDIAQCAMHTLLKRRTTVVSNNSFTVIDEINSQLIFIQCTTLLYSHCKVYLCTMHCTRTMNMFYSMHHICGSKSAEIRFSKWFIFGQTSTSLLHFWHWVVFLRFLLAAGWRRSDESTPIWATMSADGRLVFKRRH